MSAFEIAKYNAVQIAIAIDCALNVLACWLTMNKGYANETLSAHAWRAREKPFGRFFLPLIDLAFRLQASDPSYTEGGKPIESHCHRAFLKLKAKAYLPPEYA